MKSRAARTAQNSGEHTHAVGEKPANEWGLYDVHGNVSEWTLTAYAFFNSYEGREAGISIDQAAIADAAATRGGMRVVRGGSWFFAADGARSAFRLWFVPGDRDGFLGFRVLLPAPEPATVFGISVDASTAPSDSRYVFQRQGDYWHLCFHGDIVNFKHIVGLEYLRILLQDPGQSYAPEALAFLVEKSSPVRESNDQDAVDQQTINELSRRLKEIKEALREVEAGQSNESAERLVQEKEQIEDYLKTVVGLGGKPRKEGQVTKQGRDKVNKAVRRALKTIGDQSPSLGNHLNSGILYRPSEWVYAPESPIPWSF